MFSLLAVRKYLNMYGGDEMISRRVVFYKIDDDEKEVVVDKNVSEIPIRYFSEFYSLEKVELPDSLKEIDFCAFSNCTSLSEINLPDGLRIIGGYAFANCESLSEIRLPKGLRIIGGYAFSNCSSLSKIDFSYGLEEMRDWCFSSCVSLSEIKLPTSLKKIGDYAFCSCKSLSKIELPDGLEKIGEGAFCSCKSLGEIIVPSSVKAIGNDVVKNCSNLKKVIVEYDDYRGLCDFIMQGGQNLFDSISSLKGSELVDKVDVVFEGPVLNTFQRIKIGYDIDNINFNISFSEVRSRDNKNEKVIDTDDEVLELVDEIKRICIFLPGNIRSDILKRVDELLNTYEIDKSELKPVFGGKDSVFSLSTKDIKNLKIDLITNLKAIIANLSFVEKYSKFFNNLDKYKKMIDSNVDSFSDGDDLNSLVENIIYMSNVFDDKRKKEIIDRLKGVIDEVNGNILDDIDLLFDDNPFTNPKELDYEFDFKLNISKLYDEINVDYKRIKPFRDLLNALNSNEIKYKDGDSIGDLILSVKFVISKLSDNKYKREVEDIFNKIVKKYFDIIKNIIGNETLLNNTRYEKIEKGIRKDLQPVLEILNSCAYLDKKFMEYKSYKEDILDQLNTCVEIINSNKLVDSNQYDNRPITSFIVEVHNKIVSNKMLDKNSVIDNLLNLLNDYIEEISDKSMDSFDDYSGFLKDIMGAIAEFNINLNLYISECSQYDKYTK